MRTAQTPSPTYVVTRRRRAFGLDAPRRPDLHRAEAAILAWIRAHAPQVFPLHAVPESDAGLASTLALLLPAGGIALLRIDLTPGRVGSATAVLAEQCRVRRIPIAVVADARDARAALRRLGVEPEAM